MLIFAKFLGPGNMDHLAGRASQRLQNLEWSRNNQTWNFDDYVAAHMAEHNIIEGLVVHGYTGIDARTKVSYLCNGIKSSALAPVQAMILADQSLRHDFSKCVTLFSDFIRQDKLSSNRDVSELGTDGGDGRERRTRRKAKDKGFGGKPGGQPPSDKQLENCTIKERYFRTEEYNALTHVEKYKLWQLRQKLGGGGGGGGDRDKDKRQLKEMSIQIAELQTQITKQAESDDDSNPFSSGSEEEEDEEQSNKNNRALIPYVRQKVAFAKSTKGTKRRKKK